MKKLWTIMLAGILTVGTAFLASAQEPADAQAITKKMKEIVIPKLDIDDVVIPEAVKQLAALAKENDKGKTGITITLDPKVSKTIVVELEDLTNISVFDAVAKLCKDKKLSYNVTADGIVLIPAPPKDK